MFREKKICQMEGKKMNRNKKILSIVTSYDCVCVFRYRRILVLFDNKKEISPDNEIWR